MNLPLHPNLYHNNRSNRDDSVLFLGSYYSDRMSHLGNSHQMLCELDLTNPNVRSIYLAALVFGVKCAMLNMRE